MLVKAEDVLLGTELVAAEQLVAAITRQKARYAMFTREARTVIGGHGRGVPEWLVVARGNGGERLYHVPWGHVVLVMLGAEVPCRDAGIVRFVVAGDVE